MPGFMVTTVVCTLTSSFIFDFKCLTNWEREREEEEEEERERERERERLD